MLILKKACLHVDTHSHNWLTRAKKRRCYRKWVQFNLHIFTGVNVNANANEYVERDGLMCIFGALFVRLYEAKHSPAVKQ